MAALSALEHAAGGLPRLRVELFGLLGPNGPMPLHLPETTRQRLRHHDDAPRLRFLDLFHHRMLSLFFRASAQNQPAVQHDRPREDRFAAWLGAFAGLGQAFADGRRSGPMAAAAGQRLKREVTFVAVAPATGNTSCAATAPRAESRACRPRSS